MPLSRDEAFSILGLQDGATEDQIKKAYRKEALRWHPDKNNGSEESNERFKQVNAAWVKLTKGDEDPEDEEYEEMVPDLGQFEEMLAHLFGMRGFGMGFGTSGFFPFGFGSDRGPTSWADEACHSGYCDCRSCRRAGRGKASAGYVAYDQHAEVKAAAAKRNQEHVTAQQAAAKKKAWLMQLPKPTVGKRSSSTLEIKFTDKIKEIWVEGLSCMEMELKKTSERDWISFNLPKPKAAVTARDLEMNTKYEVRVRAGLKDPSTGKVEWADWSKEGQMSTMKEGEEDNGLAAAKEEAPGAKKKAEPAPAPAPAPKAAAPAKAASKEGSAKKVEPPPPPPAPTPQYSTKPQPKPKKKPIYDYLPEDPEEMARKEAEEREKKRVIDEALARAAAEYEQESKKITKGMEGAGKKKKAAPAKDSRPQAPNYVSVAAKGPVNPIAGVAGDQQSSSDWRKYIPGTLPVNPLGQVPRRPPAPLARSPLDRSVPGAGPQLYENPDFEDEVLKAIEMSERTFRQEQELRKLYEAQRAADSSYSMEPLVTEYPDYADDVEPAAPAAPQQAAQAAQAEAVRWGGGRGECRQGRNALPQPGNSAPPPPPSLPPLPPAPAPAPGAPAPAPAAPLAIPGMPALPADTTSLQMMIQQMQMMLAAVTAGQAAPAVAMPAGLGPLPALPNMGPLPGLPALPPAGQGAQGQQAPPPAAQFPNAPSAAAASAAPAPQGAPMDAASLMAALTMQGGATSSGLPTFPMPQLPALPQLQGQQPGSGQAQPPPPSGLPPLPPLPSLRPLPAFPPTPTSNGQQQGSNQGPLAAMFAQGPGGPNQGSGQPQPPPAVPSFQAYPGYQNGPGGYQNPYQNYQNMQGYAPGGIPVAPLPPTNNAGHQGQGHTQQMAYAFGNYGMSQ